MMRPNQVVRIVDDAQIRQDFRPVKEPRARR